MFPPRLLIICVILTQLFLVPAHGQSDNAEEDEEMCFPFRRAAHARRPQPNQQGAPGKQGPPGPVGERGVSGSCGCNPSEVEQLNSTIQNLTGELRNMRSVIIGALRNGWMELEDGWIAPFNGYQYKLVRVSRTWEGSRTLCQGMGGDLATFGAQDWETRRIIRNAFNELGNTWIGLTDMETEGTWKWVNGYNHRTATLGAALWGFGQPGDDTNENCALITGDFYTHDFPCGSHHRGLCEKMV